MEPRDEPSGGPHGERAADDAGRRRVPWGQKSRRERGIALVWMSLTLLVMLTFAGFAIDISNWYLQAEKVQRAADAAAHAGVVFLPGDVTNAKLTARREAAKNNYNDGIVAGGANATVAPAQEANPNRLRVKITTDVPSFFAQLVGIDEITISREAVAEYIAPVAMGSPENKLGNDPEDTSGYDPELWINLAGPKAPKEQGERYSSKACSSSSGARCSGTVQPGITNDDFMQDGYFFAVDVKSNPGGSPLKIQLYDPALVSTGLGCGDVTYPSSAQRTTLAGFLGADATSRYQGGSTDWCTGDIGTSGWGGGDMYTSVVVREPDDTPWSDTDNPIVSGCTASFKSYVIGSSPSIYNLLHPSDGVSDSEGVVNASDGVWTFAEAFRRWVSICEIPSSNVKTGKYIVQIRSSALPATPQTYNSSVYTGGHNKFSLRAGFSSTSDIALSGTNAAVYARGRLPIYANAPSADTTFYLARVYPEDAGRTLRVTLWDVGEASSGGSLQLIPPADANVSTFSGCTFAKDNGGSLTVNASTCKLSNVTSTLLNGRLLTIDVPIPDDYTCDSDVSTGCWVTVNVNFGSASSVTDATTWTATILGNPVRLVE